MFWQTGGTGKAGREFREEGMGELTKGARAHEELGMFVYLGARQKISLVIRHCLSIRALCELHAHLEASCPR
jgi:hypothetical protein